MAFTIQPATVPPGGTFAENTELFMSSLDPTNTLDNRLTVWALTGTDNLATTVLTRATVATQVYGFGPSMQQRPGPAPLVWEVKTKPPDPFLSPAEPPPHENRHRQTTRSPTAKISSVSKVGASVPVKKRSQNFRTAAWPTWRQQLQGCGHSNLERGFVFKTPNLCAPSHFRFVFKDAIRGCVQG